MLLQQIGPNQTLVTFMGGSWVLFSYNTPVVLCKPNCGRVFVTSKYHSKTTTKHVADFVEGLFEELFALGTGTKICTITQEDLDAFVASK
jgi:hypothetical protein